MDFEIIVENIKCGGCANSIQNQLNSLDGVSHTQVDVETGKVSCQLVSEARIDSVKKHLLKLGYPAAGSVEGLGAMGAKAKSYVSCAIGKMQKEA
ncbi:MAG: heavy metal transporter [Piscirickettsiaceae bacterium CG_4_9_14_3_um_filter_43_564]|nr:heavy-metal-associated domain-containing protein [Thiomicrospira sp.]OIP96324.1 MAG: heavy metal transporter [Thiomicrospira sp. CG2_30_44_34]PIQ04515.1 MAG: heavy metal transporter [Piscirickettsiaceae bacterium CG18_big_fil_WC_8_21_14_2_50_44_103]PIU38715.1 MAG: heavy metal transporter [Piscirickettsiaceae bacterium CG07_land_8_20_14_0_80_44_28]PIW58085.1 MAG: heavy metal transporter [Piscirickettsiaceae bacterium CG12_big_fil_rev_8_21_14_0_65_44_934]PIW78217.1 MAG: heavy metal transporte